MNRQEAKKTLIDCRALLRTLVDFKTIPPDLPRLVELFEVDKMIDSLEEIMGNMDILFKKGE